MVLIFGALCDPTCEHSLVARGEFFVGVGRRHHLVLVLRVDAHDEFALRRLARGKGLFGERRLAHVKAKLALAVRGVGAVASEAVVGQQRPHIAVELDLRRDSQLRSERWPKGQQGEQQANGPTAHQRGHSAGKMRHLAAPRQSLVFARSFCAKF